MRQYVAFMGNLKIVSHNTQGGNIWENPGADSVIVIKLLLKK